MLFDKLEDVGFFKSYHRAGLVFAVTWAFPPYTWDLAAFNHLVDIWQTTFKDMLNLFRGQQWLKFIFLCVFQANPHYFYVNNIISNVCY